MELAISLVPAIDQVLVIGEGRPYLAAILALNAEAWPKLAQRFRLDPDADDSLDNDKLHAYLLKKIKACLKDFPGYAKIRRVIPALEPWTVDNGLLTPTLKTKRARILKRFADRIEALYAAGPVGRG